MSNNKNKIYLHDSIAKSKSKGNENKFYKKKVIRYNFDKKFKKRPMSTFSVDHELPRKMLNYEINFVLPAVEKTML